MPSIFIISFSNVMSLTILEAIIPTVAPTEVVVKIARIISNNSGWQC